MNKTETKQVLDALKLLDPELIFENWENGDGEEIHEQLRAVAAICEASLARVVEPDTSVLQAAKWPPAGDTQPIQSMELSDADHNLNCAKAEIAGLSTSTFHLSAMVDELRVMLGDAMDAMTDLHIKVTPDEDTPDIDGIVPAAAYARFSDAHANLLYRIHNSPHAGQLGKPVAAINAKVST